MKKNLIFIIAFALGLFCLGKALSKSNISPLPDYIKDYKKWTRINKNVLQPTASSFHPYFNNVYINKTKDELLDSNGNLISPLPVGAIVVKEGRTKAKKNSRVSAIAIMRKTASGNESTSNWDFIEFTRKSSKSFSQLQYPKESCFSCHQGAASSDYIFIEFDNL